MARAIYIETYGCQMNLADTELLLGHLARHGIRRVPSAGEADVILLNTCAIREHAEERVVGRLTQLLEHKRRASHVKLGIVGCMAQHHRERLLDRLPFLDLILGPDEYRKLPGLCGEAGFDDPLVEVRLGREETYADIVPAREDGVRAWVTIMRGCDRFCTFCIVPFVRGRERSLPLPLVLDQVRQAAAGGYREVVFLGQTVNAYRDRQLGFADLLRATARLDGIERIRFTSPHPSDVNEEMIEVMATEPKICPQIHLPLQSASDSVLERMERGYTIEEYDRLVRRLRDAVPGIELSTDVIVGFPGEREEDFRATRDYVARVGYDSAFLFAYSRRDGTRAGRWPDDVSPEDKRTRLAELIELQEGISAARGRAWRGRTVEVLVEGPARRQVGWLAGKSREFRTTVFPSSGQLPGELVSVRVEDSTAHTLIGRTCGIDAEKEAAVG